MAKVNLIAYEGNKKKNKNNATAGKLSFSLPGGLGSMVTGDEYKVASIPANSLITNVDLIVSDAFNGTTPTADVVVGGTVVHDDIDISATGVTSDETRIHVTSVTDVEVVPTFTDSTSGEVIVVVNFVELDAYDGAFTE